MRVRQRFLGAVLFLLIVAACSPQQKMLKTADPKTKFELAKTYYTQGKYYRALPLFDELFNIMKGTADIEQLLYYYAYCYYHTGEYLVAAYHFKSYATQYPNAPHAEECLFMHAMCYYTVSPGIKLDQTYTQSAMDAIRLFVNNYPQSRYLPQANEMLDRLHAKLEQKAFYNAYLYFHMEKYKAAITAFENFLRDFPDAQRGEEVQFLMLKSNYLYALNSAPRRQLERFERTLQLCSAFQKKFGQSPFLNEAKLLCENSQKFVNKLTAYGQFQE